MSYNTGMKETLKKIGKIGTIVTMPIELYLIAHGIVTGREAETTLGTIGLGLDFLTLWILRDNKNQLSRTSLQSLSSQRGSEKLNGNISGSWPRVPLTITEEFYKGLPNY